jgi:hypothetical protein
VPAVAVVAEVPDRPCMVLCLLAQCDGAAVCVLAAHHAHYTGAGQDDGNKHHKTAGQQDTR